MLFCSESRIFSETANLWDLQVPSQMVRALQTGITSISPSTLLSAIGQRLSDPQHTWRLPPAILSVFRQCSNQSYYENITVETLREPVFTGGNHRDPTAGYDFLGPLPAIPISATQAIAASSSNPDSICPSVSQIFSMNTTSPASLAFINTWQPTTLLNPANHYFLIFDKQPFQTCDALSFPLPPHLASPPSNWNIPNEPRSLGSNVNIGAEFWSPYHEFNGRSCHATNDPFHNLDGVELLHHDHSQDEEEADEDVQPLSGETTMVSPLSANRPVEVSLRRECGISDDLWEQAQFVDSSFVPFNSLVINFYALTRVLNLLGFPDPEHDRKATSFLTLPDGTSLQASDVVLDLGWTLRTYERKTTYYSWAKDISDNHHWLCPVADYECTWLILVFNSEDN